MREEGRRWMESLMLDDALVVACDAARKAGAIHKDLLQSDSVVRRKNHLDIVTAADIQAEQAIISNLTRRFPEHLFSSEELYSVQMDDTQSHVPWRWIIDPLDGTINYANGLPFYSVSLALQYFNETVLAVVYDTASGTLYSALKGKGAFKNDLPLQVSLEQHLSNSVLSFMLTSHYSQAEIDQTLQLVNALACKTRGLRLFVSQALELAFVAEGKLQGTICIKSRGFSSAAGALLVREAQGQVTDLYGNDFGNASRSIVATNHFIHEDLLRSITR
jgi:myo-inositol-1(or 4)-monophosphatase